MKKLLLLALLPLFSYGQGIRFENGLDWQQVQAKAKAENKFIFMDCYASWCGPCKLMERTVYTDTAVANFFNAHFINVKLQMDKTSHDNDEVKNRYADAESINTQYLIGAYPSFLFFTPEGLLVHRAIGYQEAADFIKLGRAALDPQQQYMTLLAHYKDGQRVPLEMYDLAYQAKGLDDQGVARAVSADEIKTLLSLNENELYTPDHIRFIAEFTINTSDPGFAWFADHGNAIDQVMNSKTFCRDTRDKVIMKEYIKAGGDSGAERRAIAQNYDAGTADRCITKAKIYASYGKDWPAFTAALVHYTNQYEDKADTGLMLKNAGLILQHSNNKSELQSALNWCKEIPGETISRQLKAKLKSKS